MWANVCYNGGFKTYPVVFFLKIPKKGMVLEKTYEIVNPNNMHVQYGFDKDRKRFCSSKKTDRLDYDLAQCMSTVLETFFVFEIDGNILEFHFNENNFEDDN